MLILIGYFIGMIVVGVTSYKVGYERGFFYGRRHGGQVERRYQEMRRGKLPEDI